LDAQERLQQSERASERRRPRSENWKR
jgi:hypothetical protein